MLNNTKTKKLDSLITLKIEESKKENFARIASSQGKTISGWLKEFIDSVLEGSAPGSDYVPEITKLKADVEELQQEVAILRSEMSGKLAA